MFLSKLKELVNISRLIISNTYKEMLNMSILLNVADTSYLRAFKVQRELIQILETFIKNSSDESTNGSDGMAIIKASLSIYEFFLSRNKKLQFSEILINNVITELLFAGLDTIVVIVNSLILYVTLQPDIQKKIQSELERLDVLKVDLSCSPFTHACILETLR